MRIGGRRISKNPPGPELLLLLLEGPQLQSRLACGLMQVRPILVWSWAFSPLLHLLMTVLCIPRRLCFKSTRNKQIIKIIKDVRVPTARGFGAPAGLCGFPLYLQRQVEAPKLRRAGKSHSNGLEKVPRLPERKEHSHKASDPHSPRLKTRGLPSASQP